MNLLDAPVYDIETFPNAFTLRMELLGSTTAGVWEISDYRDDRRELITWFNWLAETQTPMIGFNNIHFDYPVVDFFFKNPNATAAELYEKAQAIFSSFNRFEHTVWQSDRFAPQIDLFKIHHFDNPAKSTGLKALQINMRSPSVVDMPVEIGTRLTEEQINNLLIPYNGHDVKETKRFAWFSMEALKFRQSLIPQFGIDVMNWPDTKIGSRMMEEKLGRELCYEYQSNEWGGSKRVMRQTPRTRIALNDIIFPYINFEQPEFNRVLQYLRGQVLTSYEIDQFTGETKSNGTIKTKGVFTDLSATINGFSFDFGTGGIHGSVNATRIVANDDWIIRDIDVEGLYPNIAIKNQLAPAHLGQRFTEVYSQLPLERKKWQAEKGKKCVEANTLKLASNGVYGNSNNKYSVFYDPQYMLSITVNGQLMLCMLAERLMKVPTLQIIQINTDGITYFVHRDHEPAAAAYCREWEKLTALTLEDANYSRMWIRDVNSYIAESVDGSLKLKGAYWAPDPLDYHGSISAAQPSAWHKDLGNVVSVRAAVAAMVHGVDPSLFIAMTANPYDFMCRIKVKKSDRLSWGGADIQKNSRYYISRAGRQLVKIAPPTGPAGSFKKAPKVSDAEYKRVMAETGGAWDSRVCTKNKSVHEVRETHIQAGHAVQICNDVRDFNFADLNYEWYVAEANKLIIT